MTGVVAERPKAWQRIMLDTIFVSLGCDQRLSGVSHSVVHRTQSPWRRSSVFLCSDSFGCWVHMAVCC
jgi:hypothetical protein